MTPSAPATVAYCASCAAVLEGGTRYCVNCGHRIAPPAPPTPPAQPVAPLAPLPPAAQVSSALPPAAPRRPVSRAPSEDTGSDIVGLEIAGFGSRFGGFVIDFVVNLVILLIAALSIGWVGIFAPFAALLVFNSTGISPGKAVVGIRIVNQNGDPPGLAAGLGRTLVATASWWVFWLGYLWAAGGPDHRTWHDLAAGTYVILDEQPQAETPR